MTDLIAAIRQIATQLRGVEIPLSEIENPNFSDRSGWAWYVDDDVQKLWNELSEESRWVACIGSLNRYQTDQGLCPFP